MSHSDSPNTGTVRADVLLTIAEVAERLGVSRPAASLLADIGKLGDVVTGSDGHRRVRASAIEECRVARSERTNDAASPRAAGVNAGLYGYSERYFQKRTVADLLAEMPDGLPRVPGWDEMPDVGFEVPRVSKC